MMYGDQILNTEMINETLSNRQSAKMIYLQKENEQLLQENEDLKEALKLNKEALRISYQSTFLSESASTSFNSIPSQQSKIIHLTSSNKNQQHLQSTYASNQKTIDDFVLKLIQENERLLGTITVMAKERNKAQSIALLQEQIAEENSNFYQEQLAEREDKIKELRMLIQDKEFVIQDFEKAKGYYDYGSNVLVRIRDITTPNEQSIKLHNEIEHLKGMIQKLSEENQKLVEKIQQKEEHSRVLKQEILKLRLVILNPVNYQKMKGFLMHNYAEKGDEDAFMCGAFYKQVENQQMEEQNQQLMQQQQMLQQQYQKEQYEKQHIPLRPSRNNNQPQTQRYNNQYAQNLQTDKLNDKIQKLEESFKKINKLYRREVENNNILVSKIEEIMKECEQCFQNNELLINSNINYQQQIENLQNQVKTYKEFQQKYFHLLRNHRKRNKSCLPNQSITNQIDEIIKKKLHERRESESTATQNQKTNDKEVNVSILEEEEESKPSKSYRKQTTGAKKYETIRADLAQKNNQNESDTNNILGDINEEVTNLTRDQAKIYLLNLAKDLYVNTNIKSSGLTRQVLKQIEIGGYKTGIISLFRAKRSLSNPLDYISDNEETKYSLNYQVDFNEIVKKSRLQFKKHSDGNQNANNHHYQQAVDDDQEIAVNLDKGLSGPFNIDMSVIIDGKSKLGKGLNVSKKIHKIAVDASFISNDGDMEDFN
ncbi:hypothetical protein TTHERM_00655460 (macronuclear) [Tetrahymena thermophila SB210]|uniref:Uncharacterized protein n=1 Tax=Tetrahymena thermophila (strain SB210) TaxID=312017 RepID=Q22H06_TETTS|nr:hypothetical protein TTHERM_00655460 [Tetrahymena thermophila SB210]EAR84518.1 hypothetical protein TTHERM_00655460 [Tetrahymena thermophila SB210]|eukprot:XP_001032181.1 hypothetical protein TTHERM_00655460 [Tetrahymena thermophila SB210]